MNPITSQWPGVKEPNGAGSAWEVKMLSADRMNAVRSILPGGCNHEMFNSWLERLAKNFHQWRDERGVLIPFISVPTMNTRVVSSGGGPNVAMPKNMPHCGGIL